jgi:hypothetical protein
LAKAGLVDERWVLSMLLVLPYREGLEMVREGAERKLEVRKLEIIREEAERRFEVRKLEMMIIPLCWRSPRSYAQVLFW